MIHHLVLMISSLSSTQLDQLSLALKKLGDSEKHPLARPVRPSDEGIESVIDGVDSILDNDAEHQRLWNVIERLEHKLELIELNREAF